MSVTYPVVLCGDQLEFEQEYENMPAKERPDWPLPSFDARDWAEAFCKIAATHGFKDAKGEPLDEGWMTTWFANALMRGFDEQASRAAQRIEALESALRGVIAVADRKTIEFDAARAALALSDEDGR